MQTQQFPSSSAVLPGFLVAMIVLASAGCTDQERQPVLETQRLALNECQADEDCLDAPPCTQAKCAAGTCRYVKTSPLCCTQTADCQPYDSCVKAVCALAEGEPEGICDFPADPLKPGCCNYPYDCDLPPPGYVATCETDKEAGYKKCDYIIDPESCLPPSDLVVISEFMANPGAAPDATGEWVELFNPALEPAYLNGWTIADDDADAFTFESGNPIIIEPGGYFLLGRSDNYENNGKIEPDFIYYNFTLSNGEDEIVLFDENGAEVDRVMYGPPAFTTKEGTSMELVSPYMDNQDWLNWRHAQEMQPPVMDKGTPGQPNADAFYFYFTPVVCNDKNSCTLDTCGVNGKGTCTHTPIQDCCLLDFECDDGNVCTTDQCKPETLICIHNPVPGCCNQVQDCVEISGCMVSQCVNHTCRYTVHPEMPGCCVDDEDCTDINPCTIDFCMQDPGIAYETCHYKSPGGVQCCMMDIECLDDMSETVDSCQGHQCKHIPNPEFCMGPPPAYCNDDDPCTLDQCNMQTNLCTHEPIPGCCHNDDDCIDDDPCTIDICQLAIHDCNYAPVDGCCHSDNDCLDFMSDQDLCKIPMCVYSECRLVHLPDKNCCLTNADCDDDDACTDDTCNPGNNTCTHLPKGKSCCNTVDDCVEDGDPCTSTACVNNICINQFQQGCCKGDWECNDNNPCTFDGCLDYRCRFKKDPDKNCCLKDSHCDSPSSPCVQIACNANFKCVEQVAANCVVMPNWLENFSGAAELALLGWSTKNGPIGGFALTQECGNLGVDSCAGLTVDTSVQGGTSCLVGPLVSTKTSAEPLTLSFEQSVQGTFETLTPAAQFVVAGQSDGAPFPVELATFDGTTVSPHAIYLLDIPLKLKTSPFRLSFCATIPQGADITAWHIDSVKVGKGHPPRFQSGLEDVWLLPMQDAAWNLLATDDDGTPLTFYLTGPSHALVKNTQKVADGQHQALLELTPKAGTDLGTWRVSLEASDGFLTDRVTMVETVYVPLCETEKDCDDANFCSKDSCDPVTGCKHDFIKGCCNELTACDDGSFCTEDICQDEGCIFLAVDCNDDNLCTEDSCDPAIGCIHPNNNLSCDDQDVCTDHDTCYKGDCLGLPIDCSDPFECTLDSCDPIVGCQHKSLCSDSILCTTDVCTKLGCKSGKVPVGTPSIDGLIDQQWPASAIQGQGAGILKKLYMLLDVQNLYLAYQVTPEPLRGTAIIIDRDFLGETGVADMTEVIADDTALPMVLAPNVKIDFPGFGADFVLAFQWGEDTTLGPVASACFELDAQGVPLEVPCLLAFGPDGRIEALVPWGTLYADGDLNNRKSAVVAVTVDDAGQPEDAIPELKFGTVSDVVLFGIPDPMCLVSFCGDTVVDAGEECDDGPDNSDLLPNHCRTNCVLFHCGDDVLDAGEACDDGPLNSDVEADACRTNCALPSCGDNVVDTDELCDDGEFNSDETPDACRLNCQPAGCGDSVTDAGEECDDGPANNDQLANACRTNCALPWCGDDITDEGEECDNGELNNDEAPNACRTNCALPWCGDGIVDKSEQCDDGPGNSDEEPGACRTTCLAAHCGDNVLDPGEECDDGNVEDWDGCQSDCVVYITTCGDGIKTPNEECDNGEQNSDEIPDACRTSCLTAHCGDNVLDTGEQCDDGNLEGGDECGLDCKPYVAYCGNGWIDEGEECDNGKDNDNWTPDACRKDCTLPSCGDSVVDTGEECDKGPKNSDEFPNACRTDCLNPHCGDNVIDKGETCDDGTENADEPNHCKLDCSLPDCGDGLLDDQFDEECDWGELNSNIEPDACRLNCLNAHCGDKVLDSGEECDKGLLNSDSIANACRLNCLNAHCGDGTIDTGEECDNGPENADAPDHCKLNCVAPVCGDGIMDGGLGEECDWGVDLNSNVEPDTCRTNCMSPHCGDLVVDGGEECDDGNDILGDGCAPDCTIESYIPDPGDVIISEIMQNPAKVYDTMGEYIELYNTRDFDIDINKWDISDTSGDMHTIIGGGFLVVPAKGYLVLGIESDLDLNGGVPVDYEYSGVLLGNGSDEIIISYKGAISDEVNYDGGPLFPDPKGASMSLAPPFFNHLQNDIGSSWCESFTPLPSGDKGTPGQPNDSCK